MVFHRNASETTVEETKSNRSTAYPSAVLILLKIILFLKWTGCFPVTVSQTRFRLFQFRFAGCRIATVQWIVVFGLQISLTVAYITMRGYFARIPDIIIYALFQFNICCSVIFIPRFFFAKRRALQSTLNNLTEIHRSFEFNHTQGKVLAISITLLLFEFLMLVPNIMKAYSSESDVIGSPVFSIGTGNSVIGFAMYMFWNAFYYISLLIVPIQLYILSQTVASYLEDLTKEIQSLNVNLVGFNQREVLDTFAPLDTNPRHYYKMRIKTLHGFCIKLEKTVDTINEYLGVVLSLFFLCHVVDILNNLNTISKFAANAAVLFSKNSFAFAYPLVCLIRDVAELLFVIWAADLLASAVTTKRLRGYGLMDVFVSFQFQYFLNHLASMRIEISAVGFFSISRKTILPVLGIIITYYLVIVQYADDYGRLNSAKKSTVY